jgi:DNA-binding MarR family transcriptional regulator
MTHVVTLATLIDRLGRISHALQFSAGLNPAQWEALRYLARANRYSCSPSALAKYLGCTKGTVSQTLISLETKGYVNRVRGDPDGRSVRLELTDEGRKVLDQDPLRLIEEAGNALPESERAAVTAAMKSLIRSLCDREGLSEFGDCGDCSNLNSKEPCVKTGEPCACGLTGEALGESDLQRICVDFRPSSSS